MSQTTASSRFDLTTLSFADAVLIGQLVRAAGEHAPTARAAAARIVDLLYDSLQSSSCTDRAETLQHSAALLRCFLTQPFRELPPEVQTVAQHALPGILPETRCLTLLATRGAVPAWNTPETSSGHRAIPLPDIAMIDRAPMIARLLSELGITAEEIVSPSGLLLDAARRSFNVFYVEDARDSAFIPAQQEFVHAYGIRSVIGMGGMLASGEFFAVILFARARLSREVAELFRTIALSVKLALIPFDRHHIF